MNKICALLAMMLMVTSCSAEEEPSNNESFYSRCLRENYEVAAGMMITAYQENCKNKDIKEAFMKGDNGAKKDLMKGSKKVCLRFKNADHNALETEKKFEKEIMSFMLFDPRCK